jgi:hypothetical protein
MWRRVERVGKVRYISTIADLLSMSSVLGVIRSFPTSALYHFVGLELLFSFTRILPPSIGGLGSPLHEVLFEDLFFGSHATTLSYSACIDKPSLWVFDGYVQLRRSQLDKSVRAVLKWCRPACHTETGHDLSVGTGIISHTVAPQLHSYQAAHSSPGSTTLYNHVCWKHLSIEHCRPVRVRASSGLGSHAEGTKKREWLQCYSLKTYLFLGTGLGLWFARWRGCWLLHLIIRMRPDYDTSSIS